MKQYFAKTLQNISLKMICTSCTDEVKVNVPSFQIVTPFLRYKIFYSDVINLRFYLSEDVTDYQDLRRINFKSPVSIGVFVTK